jgi:NAD(P)-dependent dehydrogenase (short-subunit alcohol dehydrogenase family)
MGGSNLVDGWGISANVIPFRYAAVQTRSWTPVPNCQRLGGMGRYDDKRVVITGGSSGLGLATAKHLMNEGARVLITGRTPEKLAEAGRQLGGDAVAVESDTSSLPQIDALAERVKVEFGTVDALVVNAGIGSFDPFDAVTEETWDDVFAINTKGPFFTVQRLAPLLTEGSSVILNTSIANQTGWDALSVYSASKAALRSMARTLGRELLPRKIRVNAISPGSIDTGKLEKELPAERAEQLKAQFTATNPMGRWGHPDEFAQAVAFLAFDATFMVGIELVIDGGYSQL